MIPQKTRCPSCESVFAVTAEQLAARQGQVRCGRCFKVFKADDYLVSGSDSRPADRTLTPAPASPSRVKSSVMDLVSNTPPQGAVNTRSNMAAPPIHRAVNVAVAAAAAPASPAPARQSTAAALPTAPAAADPQPAAVPRRKSRTVKALTPDMIHDDMPLPEDAAPASAGPVPAPAPAVAPAPAAPPAELPRSNLLLDEELSEFFLEQESRPRDPTIKEEREVVKLSAAADESWAEALLDEIFEDKKELRPDQNLALQPDHPTIPPKVSARAPARRPATPAPKSAAAARPTQQAGIQPAITEADELANLGGENLQAARNKVAPPPVVRQKPGVRRSSEDADNLSSFLREAGAASVAETQVFDSLNQLDPALTPMPHAAAAPAAPRPMSGNTSRALSAVSSQPNSPIRQALGIPTLRSFKRNLGYYLAWSMLCGLMIGLLVVQYVYFNFNQLSTSHNQLMQQLCSAAGCEVPVLDAATLELKRIKARKSTLGPGITHFEAVLINQSKNTQAMPKLRLTVYENGQISAGVVVTPAQYLTGDRRDISRLPPQRPIPVAFDVQIPRSSVNKFSLDAQF